MQSTGPGADGGTANATLSLDIDHSKVDTATKALNEFDKQNKQAGGSTQQLLDTMTKLTKEMEQVVKAQRETNELIAQGTRAQREAAATIDASLTSFTRWTTTVAVGSAAWNYFTRDMQKGAQETQTQIQQLTGSVDALNQKMRDTQTIGSSFTGKIGNTPFTSQSNAAVDGSLGIATLNSQLSQLPELLGQRLSVALLEANARTNIAPDVLLSGSSYGQRLGVSDSDSLRMMSQMQQAMTGVSLENIRARQTLELLGVDLTDARTAMRSTIDKLSQLE